MTSETVPSTFVLARTLMNKVPEVTIFFWIIKILCTTVGESAADFLNYNLNWGLTGTSIATGLLLVVVLTVQMSLGRYVAAVYWLTVVLVSVFGTLVTDNLTDNLNVPLEASTVIFSVLLALVFLAWYLSERTLSIHSIYTRRREAFYWLAILVTFALGTATGDLVSEGLGVGYLRTGILCAVLIAVVTLAWRLGLNAVLAFWVAYILTRPLGASIGDFLAQPTSNGGLGLGVTVTSVIFLSAILITIIYLSVRKPDVIEVPTDPVALAELDEPETAPHHRVQSSRAALVQTAVVVLIAVVGGGAFYAWRTADLNAAAAEPVAAPVVVASAGSAPESPQDSPAAATSSTTSSTALVLRPSPLGDMSVFVTITQDTLTMLEAGDQPGATAQITDLESAWDNAQATLERRNTAEWHAVDDRIDTVLRELRSTNPNSATEAQALRALLNQMGA